MLVLDSVYASYGKVEVLNNISIEILENQIVALLGPNGAGKTTTLQTIMGFIKPTKGEIKYEDKRIDRLSPAKIVRLGISMVPEERQIFNQMTVFGNLETGSFIQRNKRAIRNDLDRVFTLFPILKQRRNQNASTLSGGEQQMLAIGRALMSSPRLLILDEPSLGLAPILVNTIFETLKEINILNKYTIFLVEQNARKALSLCHFGYILENGTIVLKDNSEKLKQNSKIKEVYLGQ